MHATPPIPASTTRALALSVFAWLFAAASSQAALPVESIAQWGVSRLERYAPRTTQIGSPVKRIALLPRGEIAFLSESQFVTFDGTQWATVAELDRPMQLIPAAGDQAIAGHVGGMTRLTPNRFGGYDFEQLKGSDDGASPPLSIRSLATARGHVFGSHGASLTVVAPDGTARVHRLDSWASTLFSIGDEVYATGGTLALLNRWDWETERLVDCQQVLDATAYAWFTAVQPRQEGGVWLLNENNQIIGYDGAKTWFWKGNDELARRHAIVQCFVEAGPDRLAIGTTADGALVFDREGTVTQEISKPHGLDSVSVLGIGADTQNGLWISTKRSLSRSQLDPNVLLFDERHGVPETVNAVEICNDRLYLGTPRGLYVNNPDAASMEEAFILKLRLPGVSDLLSHRGKLFVAASNFAMVDENEQVAILSQEGASSLWSPSADPELVLAGSYRGILASRLADGQWQPARHLDGPEREVFGLTENDQGVILGSLGGQEFAKVTLRDGRGRFETRPIPTPMQGIWSALVALKGDIYVNSNPSMRWNTAQDAFEPSPEVVYYVGGPPYGFEQVFGTSYEDAWVCVNARRGATLPRPNSQVIGQIASINDALDTRANALAYDPQGSAWAGGNFGLVLSLKPQSPPAPLAVAPRIHRLLSIQDGAILPVAEGQDRGLRLEPGQNSLRVEAEFPQFFATNQNQLQIFLEGLDTSWPDFNTATFREFTHLPPGSYLLIINARNTYGQEASYRLPLFLPTPWYQTHVAFASYFAAGLLLVALVVYLYNREQIRRSRRLQKLVAERTREIAQKNSELEEQATRLEQQNEELEEKTEELTSTTETLTATLRRLQEMQDQLVSTARTAGKAEIAINVLHSVGNVLNSLNVSVNLLAQRAQDSKAAKLTRLAGLVSSHQDSIADFLTNDARGRNVPNYLIQLSNALEEEVASLRSELHVMSEDIDHVKTVIAAQQTHAKSESLVEKVSLYELCQTALSIVVNERRKSQVEIANDVPPELTVENDKHRLLDIVLNLTANALDAIDEQKPEIGMLSLIAGEIHESGQVEFSVIDNGSGIAPENREKLFRHGFTTKANGHGFGLHSSANAAKSLGGQLTLSSPGKGLGTIATLTLPASLKAQTAPR